MAGTRACSPPRPRPGPNDQGTSRLHLVQAGLKRLGIDPIDFFQRHGWDPATPVEETLRALDELVRYSSVSNWAAWQMAKAQGVSARLQTARIQSVQAYYSVVRTFSPRVN